MPFFHLVYGLRIEADRTIPGLSLVESTGPPDVRVWFDAEPPHLSSAPAASDMLRYRSPWGTAEGEPTLTVWDRGDCFWFRYSDGTEFWVRHEGTEVWSKRAPASTLEDATTYLLGPVLGFTLRLRGVTCLHSSAVVVAEHALALAGPPGAGKSTTAAAFARRGHSILADDIVPLSSAAGVLWAEPGYPRLNLWPDSAVTLFGEAEPLPRITPNWEKQFLDLSSGGRFVPRAVPVGAVYLLDGSASSGAAPRLELVPPRDALMELVSNTYTNYLLDAKMRAHEFQFLGRVVTSVPVRRLRFFRDRGALGALPGAILRDFQEHVLR